MKAYPSIPGSSDLPMGQDCLAFRKYDGSNLRFVWKRGKGWAQFGTRRRLFDAADPEYGCAVGIFLNKYGAGAEKIICDRFKKAAEVICFCEFFGPNSFGGQHDPQHPALLGAAHNDPKDVVLIDVNIHKRGLLSPYEFVEVFDGLPVAQVVYSGPLTTAFVTDVREGKYDLQEGVVCKGVNGPLPHNIWMRKVKTFKYLEELKRRFGTGWQDFWE